MCTAVPSGQNSRWARTGDSGCSRVRSMRPQDIAMVVTIASRQSRAARPAVLRTMGMPAM
ncbi:hypothetical protein Ate01nite_39240 [Actinoplanes teichomyceticus]|nr:hypothetical protein Ate01nite_39240 [Actinoplanes teichomyceticus]